MSKYATWKDVFFTALIALPLLGGLGYMMWKGDKKRPDLRSELLEVCEELVKEYTTESLLGVSPKIVPTGGGGIFGYSQPLILWKNDEFNVNIQCLGRRFGASEIIVDQFIVNGEDKTYLIRREEREK